MTPSNPEIHEKLPANSGETTMERKTNPGGSMADGIHQRSRRLQEM